jgi:DNA-binding CsgD family transcriptional regulator
MSIFARHELDQERQAVIMHRTWELAMTGHFRNSDEVFAQLRLEKFDEAQLLPSAKLVRLKIDGVCNKAAEALKQPLPELRSAALAPDADAIWQVLAIELAAFWMRRFDAYAPCFVQSPRFRFHAWVREEGMTIRTGWDEFAGHIREDMARDPVPNPYFAFESTFDNRNMTIIGDVAWCTYNTTYQTADLPGYRGPGIQDDVRIFERHNGMWRTAFFGFFNLNFGQTDAPLWEIGRNGDVIWQNSAAATYLSGESDVVIRAGRLRMREQQADEKLAEAIAVIADLDYGFLSRRRSMPVVVGTGYDAPATVWWVIAENGKLTISYNNQPLLLARLDTAARAFALSPAQHRLVTALVEGMALIDAAKHEGVSLGTAKTQLQRIFAKVGVRTQAALVRALMAVTERN